MGGLPALHLLAHVAHRGVGLEACQCGPSLAGPPLYRTARGARDAARTTASEKWSQAPFFRRRQHDAAVCCVGKMVPDTIFPPLTRSPPPPDCSSAARAGCAGSSAAAPDNPCPDGSDRWTPCSRSE